MRRTPMKRKRETPRRKAPERVPGRMKPKAGASPTAEEKNHHTRVRALPCIVPGCARPSTLHHATGSIHGGRVARSHRLVVNLCALHHQIQFGPKDSVEALSHRGFYEKYGIDLLAEADRLWRETEESL